MARKAVFDPSDRSLFDDQRRRFDWSLLQNGSVARYENAFQLASANDRLAALGYLVHRMDAHTWTSLSDMYDAFADSLSYPRSYGGSLDALSDVFDDVGTYTLGSDPHTTGTVVCIASFDTLITIDTRRASALLDIFARSARLAALYAHPMLCLVETTNTELGRVGGMEVLLGSIWDTPPDPPSPFGYDDLLDYEIQILTAEPLEYVAALRVILKQVLASVGRWQVLDPVVIADEEAVSQARQRAEQGGFSPPPGAELWKIAVGIRGEGDHDELDSELIHAHQTAGLPFEWISSTKYPAGTDWPTKGMNLYPNLFD